MEVPAFLGICRNRKHVPTTDGVGDAAVPSGIVGGTVELSKSDGGADGDVVVPDSLDKLSRRVALWGRARGKGDVEAT